MRFSTSRPSRINSVDDISGTPQAIVIRSLRRRFCLAFREGDADAALRIYKAKRADWERWTEYDKVSVRSSNKGKGLERQLSNLTLQPTDDSQDVNGLLQLEMNPSEYFRADDYFRPNDPYDDEQEEIMISVPLPKPRRREPFSMFRFGDKGKKEQDTSSNDEESSKTYMTTPLHEAARLGCGQLVRFMLAHNLADCQKRNGQNRTPLHTVAGGIVQEGMVGIGPLFPATADSKPSAISGSKMTRFFRRESRAETVKPEPLVVPCSTESRIDALRAITEWSNQHEAFSTSSVDSYGRSALHYAAELGRKEICDELLSSFGANLTIVDYTGRNPCELAADQNHHDLAALLEAKAVLYIDPFGVDDELYSSSLEMQHLNGLSRQTLVPPFSWFETLTDVQKERERRRDIAENKMRQILSWHIEKQELKARILSRGNTGDEFESCSTSTGKKRLDSLSGNVEAADAVLQTLRHLLERIHSCHADLLLSSNEWNVKKSVAKFYTDPIQILKDAGLHHPCILKENETRNVNMCMICCEEFNSQSTKWRHLSNCSHRFCLDCLADYVSDCAKSSMSCFTITCPHHKCKAPMVQAELADLAASSSEYTLLLENANKDFVLSAHDVCYCPHPGCAGVVKFNSPFHKESTEHQSAILETVGAVCTCDNDGEIRGPLTYEGVSDTAYYGTQKQPKTAHRFCFSCGEGMHWPISCHQLEEWKEVVRDHVEEVVGAEDSSNYEDVAQKLWMKANTRPCPKCQAPIQKNDGCNHMTCRGCRYEFCWICSGDWKQHNTETGGFFRCNRWIDQKDHEAYGGLKPDATDVDVAKNITDEQLADPTKMEMTYGTAMHEARVSRGRSREMGRLLHHYRRWNAHLESAALERNMRDTACKRLDPVVKSASQFTETYNEVFNFGGQGFSFIHAAFAELLECRSALQHSYAYSYIRFKTNSGVREKLPRQLRLEKQSVERSQAELETMTEQLSDVVARSHLRATQTQILFLTSAAAEKRKEFSNLMVTVLAKQQKRIQKEEDNSKMVRIGRNGNPIRENADAPLEDLNGVILSYDGGAELHLSTNGSSDIAMGEESSKTEIEDAIRASLAQFMTSAGELDVLNVDSDDEACATDATDARGEWSCCACTYINSHGFRCAMCGTAHRALSSV